MPNPGYMERVLASAKTVRISISSKRRQSNFVAPPTKKIRRASKIQPEKFAQIGRADSFSECRRCLEPGTMRVCCDNYYCDECFFKQPECLSCGQDVAPRGWKNSDGISASGVDLGCAFFITIFLTLVVLSLPTFLMVSHTTAPETIHGFVCDGAVLPQCDRPACVEFESSNVDDGMVALSNWTSCHNETTSRIRASSCIFDAALFERTDGTAGWDLCTEDEGVDQAIIIEDGFEHGKHTPLRSNFWDVEKTIGAEISDRCGAAFGDKALTFSGSRQRIATTVALDVKYGGTIQFQLKYPKGFDDYCATFYSGEVTLSYSVFDTNTSTWSDHVEINTYTTGAVKGFQAEWYPVKHAIPQDAMSSLTRFSWRQVKFNERFDHFAIDGVEIVAKFDPEWEGGDAWQERKDVGVGHLHEAQCCFDTYQCASDYVSSEFKVGADCDQFEGMGWDGSYEVANAQDHQFLVLAATLTSVLRFIMTVIVHLIHHGMDVNTAEKLQSVLKSLVMKFRTFRESAKRKRHAVSMTPEMDVKAAAARKHVDTFHCRRSLRWQLFFMTFISCMLGFMSVGLFSVGSDQKKVHLKALGLDFQFQEAVTSLCAFVLDLLSIWQVARHVVCIKKTWMPTITIEKRTNKLHLEHSGSKTETYDMLYLKDLTRFSKSECRLLAALYLFGIVPWATISQVVGPMTWYLRGRPLHIYGLVTGAFAWARVFFGEEIMVKMYLAMVQLYTPDESVRGEWAKYLFTGNNFLVAGYHFVFGGTFFVVFWIAMHGFDPTDSGYIYMMYYALAFVLALYLLRRILMMFGKMLSTLFAFLILAVAEEAEPTWHDVTFQNVCHGSINVYWVKFGDESNEEVFVTTIPVNHEFTDQTDIGATYRVKWADEANSGVYGEDIVEEWIIEDLGTDQLIKVCIEARMREEL